MKILLSAGTFGKFPIANNTVQMGLADALTEMGHTCVICGVATDTVRQDKTTQGVNIIRLPGSRFLARGYSKYELFCEAHPQKSTKQFVLRCPFSALKVFAMQKGMGQKNLISRYASSIGRLVRKEHYDAVVGFAYPFAYASAVLLQNLGQAVKLYYQLDPHGMHLLLPQETKSERIAQETQLIAACDFTFTTPAMLEAYAEQPAYKPLLAKLCAQDFPVMQPPQKAGSSVFHFCSTDINIVFCGNIDNRYRAPDYILQLLEQTVRLHSEVKVFFLGSHQGGKIEQMAKDYPQNFILHGLVGAQDAAATMFEADILLNIGNQIANMVPSKIFAYFATGKPVINVQKMQQSPDRSYFAKYPLAHTVAEYAPDKTQAAQLTDFILHAKQCAALPYAEVEKIFYTATPRFVAQQIIDVVQAQKANGEKE